MVGTSSDATSDATTQATGKMKYLGGDDEGSEVEDMYKVKCIADVESHKNLYRDLKGFKIKNKKNRNLLLGILPKHMQDD